MASDTGRERTMSASSSHDLIMPTITRRIKFICRWGGTFMLLDADSIALQYQDGESKLITVQSDVSLDELMQMMQPLAGFNFGEFSLKYQLPGSGLDELVSIDDTADLDNFLEEADSANRLDGARGRLRVYIVPHTTNPQSGTQSSLRVKVPHSVSWADDLGSEHASATRATSVKSSSFVSTRSTTNTPRSYSRQSSSGSMLGAASPDHLPQDEPQVLLRESSGSSAAFPSTAGEWGTPEDRSSPTHEALRAEQAALHSASRSRSPYEELSHRVARARSFGARDGPQLRFEEDAEGERGPAEYRESPRLRARSIGPGMREPSPGRLDPPDPDLAPPPSSTPQARALYGASGAPDHSPYTPTLHTSRSAPVPSRASMEHEQAGSWPTPERPAPAEGPGTGGLPPLSSSAHHLPGGVSGEDREPDDPGLQRQDSGQTRIRAAEDCLSELNALDLNVSSPINPSSPLGFKRTPSASPTAGGTPQAASPLQLQPVSEHDLSRAEASAAVVSERTAGSGAAAERAPEQRQQEGDDENMRPPAPPTPSTSPAVSRQAADGGGAFTPGGGSRGGAQEGQGTPQTTGSESPEAAGNEDPLDRAPAPPIRRKSVDAGTLAAGYGSHISNTEYESETGEEDGGGSGSEQKTEAATEVPYMQKIPAEQLENVKELGRGSFATVMLGRWRGAVVAIKQIHKSHFEGVNGKVQLADFYAEQQTLASLAHPNIVTFYGVVEGSENGPGTVCEYVPGGSLKKSLGRLKRRYADASQQRDSNRSRVQLAADTARGLEYLHWRRVIHFDVKADNIMADVRDSKRPIGKVADLGLSKLKNSTFVSGNMRGTLPWMAPELFPSSAQASQSSLMQTMPMSQADRVTEKIDVYSFGVLMWEIWTWGEQPYHGMEMAQIFYAMMTGNLRPAIPSDEPPHPDWQSVMEACWQLDPTDRPSFSEVVIHMQCMLEDIDGGRTERTSSTASLPTLSSS